MPDVAQIGLPTISDASTLRGGKTAASASLDLGGSMARRRYQNGRVFERGKKKAVWVGRYREDLILQDGSVQRIYKSAILGAKSEMSKSQAKRFLQDEYLSRINATSYRPGRMATVKDFAETWQKEVLVHRKPSTIKAAKSHLKTHILPELKNVRLDQLSRERQQLFATRLVGRVSRKSALNILGTLSSMLATAESWKYVCEPMKIGSLVLPEAPLRPAARFFSGEEAQRIIAAAAGHFHAMFAIAAMTGARAGEILGLTLEDVDFDRKIIHIRRSAWCGKIQTVKSKASRAPVPMPDALSEILRQYLATRQPNPAKLLFVNRFGRPFNANKVVQKGLWPILDKLGIEHCGLHAFRHTHTSLLFEVGAPPTVAQAQLRHSDPRITLGIYGHAIGDSQRNAVEKVAERLRPSAPNSAPKAPQQESSGEWIQ